MSEKRTEISQLGEFGLIEHLTQKFKNRQTTTLSGIGDDAAIIKLPQGKVMAVSTDTFLEGVHFNLMYYPFKHLGYKCVVAAISDVIAMNVVPTQIIVSIAVSNRFPVEVLDELYEGIYAACDNFTIDLVGGDTNPSVSGMQITITALGIGDEEDVVYREGTKENELIVVTGDLGAAYMGLQILEREKEVYNTNPNIQPDLSGNDYLLQRQLKPEARKDILQYLKELKVKPTSMIDLSDGLASDLFQLCKSNHLGCVIYDEKVPIDGQTSLMAIEFNLDPITAALNGGDDYELLFTISQNDYDKIKGNPHMTVIGYMSDENSGKTLVDKNGSVVSIKAQGWTEE